MAQKDGFQAFLNSPWGVLSFVVIAGGGILVLALLVLAMFGLDVTGITS